VVTTSATPLAGSAPPPTRHVFLGTSSFALCFAAWGLVSAFDGALALIAVLLVVQMWLLTATLETYLAGHHEAAGPSAIVSGLLLAACVGLYAYVLRVDADVRR
jgi:hypothetical protein